MLCVCCGWLADLLAVVKRSCTGCAQQMAYTLASKTCGQYTVYASLPYIVLSCQARTCYVHTALLTWWLFFLFTQFATISFVPWRGGCFSLHA
jgi:hypothetical protein